MIKLPTLWKKANKVILAAFAQKTIESHQLKKTVSNILFYNLLINIRFSLSLKYNKYLRIKGFEKVLTISTAREGSPVIY